APASFEPAASFEAPASFEPASPSPQAAPAFPETEDEPSFELPAADLPSFDASVEEPEAAPAALEGFGLPEGGPPRGAPLEPAAPAAVSQDPPEPAVSAPPESAVPQPMAAPPASAAPPPSSSPPPSPAAFDVAAPSPAAFEPPTPETFSAPLPTESGPPAESFKPPEPEVFTAPAPDFGAGPSAAAPIAQVYPAPTRQPSSDLLPSLDDITSSVAPPEMRPPEPVLGQASGAFQQVEEDDFEIASFTLRALSAALDAVLFGGLAFAAYLATQSLVIAGAVLAAGIVALYLSAALAGTSPGKRALGLTVYDSEGESRLGFVCAGVRLAVALLTAGVGFLMLAVHEDGRGLHDRVAGTWVYRQ
ncbi:MAG: RDD family protein, partial [Acidobacteriota bacterium]